MKNTLEDLNNHLFAQLEKLNDEELKARELTMLINEQEFDKKYGMVFTAGMVKNAKSRYGFKSGTPPGNPKGYSPKYPDGMEEYMKKGEKYGES